MSDKFDLRFDRGNPEWTDADFAIAKTAESLPAAALAAFPKTPTASSALAKVSVQIHLSEDVLRFFQAGASGWEARIEDALRSVMAR
ncbi:MAG: BrnA antitoxin family protein [Rhizobiaceae bacterium]|nr:BrnA antitoxin family protein [Rhizobiaceae bacterium]